MDEQLKKRFQELYDRAERTGTVRSTKFLTVAEQSELLSLHLPCVLDGGYYGAERRAAVFGGEAADIVCLRISPVSRKFSDELGHRDFLGSLMALGINRDVLGDIIVRGNDGYLFCLGSIADYIIENLTEVKRTTVACSVAEPPENTDGGGEERSIVVASERLDAVISAVWKLPREEAKALCEKGLVFVNSRIVEKGGASIPEGAAVSVRGRGRFVYLGLERETKKGRLRVSVRVL